MSATTSEPTGAVTSGTARARFSARILGCGVLSQAGRGVEAFHRALVAAAPGQAEHDLGDPRFLGARFAAIPEPRTAPADDLATAWVTLATNDALTASRDHLAAVDERSAARGRPTRVAFLVGSSLGGMTILERHLREQADPALGSGAGIPVPALPITRALYDGPTLACAAALTASLRERASAGAVSLNTACSSAANALGVARQWLRHGRADVAIVAGVDVVSPFVYAGFQAINAIDPEPSAPFCEGRRGLNLGEAAVAFVLGRAEETEPSNCVDIIGYGSSCDAHHLTRPDLGGNGLARAIATALADAVLPPTRIDALSTHGTGTSFNDTMEAAAFVSAFGEHRPLLHCAKPVFGHTLGAAGAVDALAMVLVLQHGTLPKSYGRGSPDPALPLHPLSHDARLSPEATILSTSSGFGGSNAALVLRRADAPGGQP